MKFKYTYVTVVLLYISFVLARTHNIKIEDSQNLFDQFLETNNKTYGTKSIEYNIRFNIFKRNYQIVKELNNEKGNHQSIFGITKFMDITQEEFSKFFGLKKFDYNSAICNGTPPVLLSQVVAPDSYDWREHGAVTDVIDQGQCGSSWAFPVIGNIEGIWAVKHKKLTALSTQQLIDCDEEDFGCSGGSLDKAFAYVMKAGGLESNKDYPYTGQVGDCKFDKRLIAASIIGCNYISNNEDDIKNILYQTGPLTVAINANDLQFYSSGIDVPGPGRCDPEQINHGVLLVGYGIENNLPFWIIKNSWGKSWGEKGYFRLVRGRGACGVNRYVITGISA